MRRGLTTSASSVSRSALRFVPHTPSEPPTSGLVSAMLVVLVGTALPSVQVEAGAGTHHPPNGLPYSAADVAAPEIPIAKARRVLARLGRIRGRFLRRPRDLPQR